MNSLKRLAALVAMLILILNQLQTQIGFDCYANINTIGISADTYSADPEGDLQMLLEYKKSTENSWHKGFELTKTNSKNLNLINGSIFNCDSHTSYHIRITLVDPTTNALNGVYLDTITTKSLISFSAFTKTYYVSPSGSGSFFSKDLPGALQDAIAIVQAGERILLLSGTYAVGDLSVNQSGLENSPITFEGEAGQSVILDGSESIPLWADDLGTLGYKAQVTNKHCNVVISDGKRLYPFKSVKELKYNKIAWESYCRDADLDGFFRSGNSNTLRLKYRDGSDPNTKDIRIGRFNNFIKLENIEWLRFTNLSFKYYGTRGEAAITLKNSSNVQIDNCTFAYNDIGLRLEQGSSNIIVDNSEFLDAYGDWNFWRMKATYQGVYLLDCSGNNFITDNLPGSDLVNLYDFRGLEKGGIFVSGDYSGRGLIVKNSSFHDMVQGLSLRPQSWWTDITGKTAEVDFYDNTVYNCSEDGLEIDVFPRNVRVWNNTFHDVNAAISIASGADGPIYIFNNIFYDFTIDTTWIAVFGDYSQGRPIKTNAGSSGTTSDNTGHFYFIHNTVHAEDEHYSMDILKASNQTWNKLSFLNNIWTADNQLSLRIRTGEVGEMQSDYNCFYSDNTNLIQLNSDFFEDLPAFTKQYNIDSNSLNVLPLFTSADDNDYRLQSSSSLIDAGILIAGLNTNYNGTAPDIGAIEYKGPVGITAQILANIHIYPNPVQADKKLIIDTKREFKNGKLTLYTIDGKLVFDQKIISPYSILDLQSIEAGAYFITIILDGATETHMLLIAS